MLLADDLSDGYLYNGERGFVFPPDVIKQAGTGRGGLAGVNEVVVMIGHGIVSVRCHNCAGSAVYQCTRKLSGHIDYLCAGHAFALAAELGGNVAIARTVDA